jgi:[glutamine synthetase] adenylyltransferase / [glutamine synthetase]-adenylyl-L-tyrosine phosphorylase
MPLSPLSLALSCDNEAQVPAALARLGFDDAEAARRHLLRLPGLLDNPRVAVPFLEKLLGHLAECPDADMALNNFDRWSAQLASPHGTLAVLTENARLFADLVTVFASSQYLADILVREPTAYSLLQERDAGALGQSPMVDGRWLMVDGERVDTSVGHQPSTIDHQPSSVTDARHRGWRRCGA